MPESLKQIYDTFHHYDTFTVEQEYHHRIGILYNHSSNKASDTALRQYATLMLAQGMINESIEDLGKNYLEIANDILVMSGLQPGTPEIAGRQDSGCPSGTTTGKAGRSITLSQVAVLPQPCLASEMPYMRTEM